MINGNGRPAVQWKVLLLQPDVQATAFILWIEVWEFVDEGEHSILLTSVPLSAFFANLALGHYICIDFSSHLCWKILAAP